MKKLIVVSDPEMEVGFKTLTDYCEVLSKQISDPKILVLPIWPHGKIELIQDDDEIELAITHIKELIEKLELENKYETNN